MKKIYLFLLAVGTVFMNACDGGDENQSQSNNPETEVDVQKELAEIDMNDVDSYPLFENCSDLTTKEEQKACFEKTLSTLFATALTKNRFVVKETVSDTIVVVGKVDNKGKFVFEKTLCKDKTRELFPKLDSILNVRLNDLAPVTPALKRGIQVNTQFQAPLIVSVK